MEIINAIYIIMNITQYSTHTFVPLKDFFVFFIIIIYGRLIELQEAVKNNFTIISGPLIKNNINRGIKNIRLFKSGFEILIFLLYLPFDQTN